MAEIQTPVSSGRPDRSFVVKIRLSRCPSGLTQCVFRPAFNISILDIKICYGPNYEFATWKQKFLSDEPKQGMLRNSREVGAS